MTTIEQRVAAEEADHQERLGDIRLAKAYELEEAGNLHAAGKWLHMAERAYERAAIARVRATFPRADTTRRNRL